LEVIIRLWQFEKENRNLANFVLISPWKILCIGPYKCTNMGTISLPNKLFRHIHWNYHSHKKSKVFTYE
jgi:hypothetical protein